MKTFLVLSLAFTSCFLSTFGSDTNVSVIIIGAGPSGIAAATKLLDNNFTSILILEAESRIGGRINSVKFFDGYVDMGARWCHGQKDNIVYEMVKDMNLLGHNEFPDKMHFSSRKPIDDDFNKELFEIMEDIYGDENDTKVQYKSLGEFCEKRFNETVQQKYGNDSSKLEFALSLIPFFETYVIGGEGAFSWHDIAPFADYQDCDGDKLQNWNGKGYRIFLDVLMKKYPDPKNQLPIDDKILLNKEVSKIEWNTDAADKSVKVSCSDGTIYESDRVIFTPSVGVLKEKAEEMFVPKLPEKKMEAIKAIGLGAVMKVVLHFPQNWWGNITAFCLVWSENDRKSAISEFPEGPNLNGISWITYMNHLLEIEHNPNLLVAWFTGKLVPDIEKLPKETLINGIYFSLEKFLGHIYNISKPDKIITSQWYSNPHFRGVYSFQTPEARRISAETLLASPLKNSENRTVLHFAGEATNPIHYSTVQGAVETGYREANRVLNGVYDK